MYTSLSLCFTAPQNCRLSLNRCVNAQKIKRVPMCFLVLTFKSVSLPPGGGLEQITGTRLYFTCSCLSLQYHYLSIVQINPFRARPRHSIAESLSFRFSVKVLSRSAVAAGPEKKISSGLEATTLFGTLWKAPYFIKPHTQWPWDVDIPCDFQSSLLHWGCGLWPFVCCSSVRFVCLCLVQRHCQTRVHEFSTHQLATVFPFIDSHFYHHAYWVSHVILARVLKRKRYIQTEQTWRPSQVLRRRNRASVLMWFVPFYCKH